MIDEINKDKILKNEFFECRQCQEKPGSPVLCNACLHNRDVICRLQGEVDELRKAKDAKSCLIKALINELMAS